jgi:hypothetical protein
MRFIVRSCEISKDALSPQPANSSANLNLQSGDVSGRLAEECGATSKKCG